MLGCTFAKNIFLFSPLLLAINKNGKLWYNQACEQILGHKKGEKMFKLHSKFEPTGDQPEAIKGLVEGIERGERYQTLLGVTGSRKNFYYGKYNTKS